ncbi:sigma 54-interacting transcriptional regulator [Enterobacter chengduensis]|uniref:sigma 54-interacting transcriptional regulator n=1 Tax=Enterobacter chengduensis TaxID=2494701 RepID=UPI00200357C7|nr:sigma 54-interacting transcriptional regulator [Enterobacter chengduensis]MCK7428745.1 sigma 54-interacting transcriptional regulator [Enterobacter chengduensis]
MPEPALPAILELLACQQVDDLMTCFASKIAMMAPGGSQILGVIPFPGAEIACQVTGEKAATLHLNVDDFRHPLAQVIRSAKPAVWLSLNYGARIEHPKFRELVLRQEGECGLYAIPLLEGQGRVWGIWAILAPATTLEALLNVESQFSSLLQVFLIRSRELNKNGAQIEPAQRPQAAKNQPWRVSGDSVQQAVEALSHGKPVLIVGEKGTGKTWLAHYLHRYFTLQAPLVNLDCAVLSEEWQGIKIFGEKNVSGSALVKAHRGFLLLENIDRLAPRWHGYLQHFLDTNEVLSTDGRDAGDVHLKLILTTRDREEWKRKHAGFYHRIAGSEIYLPPLRVQRQDIRQIVERFLIENQQDLPGDFYLAEEVIELLAGYSYPGNIREMENILLDYIFWVKSSGMAGGFKALREKTVSRPAGIYSSLSDSHDSGSLKAILSRYETIVLRQRLEKYNFDKERTAASLSISRRSLDMKCKKSGIVR